HRMHWIDREFKREPASAATACAAKDPLDAGIFRSLIIEITFRLHFTGLGVGNRRCLQFALPLLLGGILGLLLRPLRVGEDIPVDSVHVAVKRAEGFKFDLVFSTDAFRSEMAGFPLDRFQPFLDGALVRDEYGDFRLHRRGVAAASSLSFWSKVPSQNQG